MENNFETSDSVQNENSLVLRKHCRCESMCMGMGYSIGEYCYGECPGYVKKTSFQIICTQVKRWLIKKH